MKGTLQASMCVAIGGIAEWASVISSLDDGSVLPARTVIVPMEAHAHALRVELLNTNPRGLAGTRFTTLDAAARAVLEHVGTEFRAGEELRRPLRLRKIARDGLALELYKASELDTAGWGEAFAATIEQLEAGGLRPDGLRQLGDPRAHDLATVWSALEADAGASWTARRIMAEAASLLEASPTHWPFDGPTLAQVTAGAAAIDARFINAIPGVVLGVTGARPRDAELVTRTEKHFGSAVAALMVTWQPPAAVANELSILAAHLYDAPTTLADPARRRSSGPDGSVTLEAYAGGAEEAEAAVRWVADEIHRHRTPLREIAVLVPASHLAAQIAARIAELPCITDASPPYVPSGRPATSTAGGARLLAVVRALESFLPADALCALLPRLRRAQYDRHLTPRHARAAIVKLGVSGGGAARPGDALGWRRRLALLDDDERTAGLGPAISALTEIATRMLEQATALELWDGIRGFMEAHVIAPRELDGVIEQIDGELRSFTSDPVCIGIVGPAAVGLIAERIRAAMLLTGRYGESAVFVGSVAAAAGLSFTAVRVVGLAEGAFPGTLRQDPLLVPELRGQLPQGSIITDEAYVTSRLQLLHRVVLGCRARLVLSVPRDVAGSDREPASLLQDVAAALGRPNAVTGESTRTFPSSDELDRDAFRPAREQLDAMRTEAPLTAACWHDRVAAGGVDLPRSWGQLAVTSPAAIETCLESPRDDVGTSPLPCSIPGLAAGNAISAGSLRMLLQCPRKFLLQRVLVNLPRAGRQAEHRIDALPYGVLLHDAADRFARRYGLAFGARDRSLAGWLVMAEEVSDEALQEYCARQPLSGEGAVVFARRRLRADLAAFLTDDWADGEPRGFVASEHAFEDVQLETASGPLFVQGRIDRIDVDQGRTLVRDLKTGSAHPRDDAAAQPQLDLDLQLALYAEVTTTLAPALDVPNEIEVAYAYVDHRSIARQRSFRGDMKMLQAAGRAWLAIAAGLLREQQFVATPDARDCRYCEFAPTCGDAVERSIAKLPQSSGVLRRFLELRA